MFLELTTTTVAGDGPRVRAAQAPGSVAVGPSTSFGQAHVFWPEAGVRAGHGLGARRGGSGGSPSASSGAAPAARPGRSSSTSTTGPTPCRRSRAWPWAVGVRHRDGWCRGGERPDLAFGPVDPGRGSACRSCPAAVGRRCPCAGCSNPLGYEVDADVASARRAVLRPWRLSPLPPWATTLRGRLSGSPISSR